MRRSAPVFLSVSLLTVGLIAFSYYPGMFSFLSAPLKAIAPVFENNASFYNRINSVAWAVSGDKGTYAYERYQLQRQSFEVFLNNPIVGMGVYESHHVRYRDIGRHSTFLDRLGQSGLVGLFIMIGFFVSYWRFMRSISFFMMDARWLLMPALFISLYLFCSVANPLFFVPNIFHIVLPGMALLFEPRQKRPRWGTRYSLPMQERW